MRGPHRSRLSAAALLLLTLGAALTPAPARGAPRIDVVLTGLEVPWALAFAPDGRLFISERPGRIRVARAGRLEPAPVATLDVYAAGESGLMGLALDPQFAANGHLYVCYTAPTSTARRLLNRALGRTPVVNRVSRLTLRDGRAGDERILLDSMPAERRHDGCRLKFGPDGRLYATMGDADAPDRAQHVGSLAGKILRIDADGTIPRDNPFPGSPVWSLGHRNPQGLAWDAAGRLWASEHGSAAHDEINLIEPGRNYGWPLVRGADTREGLVGPAVESAEQTWAPSGMAFQNGRLYVAALRGQRLLEMPLGARGGPGRPTALVDATYGRLRDVVVGPDGALYVATSNRDGRGTPRAEDDRVLRESP
jgi:aldose sugar dehydrogenase